MHKSQSTITYAVQKIERLLGTRLFGLQGRKAVLTEAGRLLYRRGRVLVEDAVRLEATAAELARGAEAEVRLAVDILFPTWRLLQCFDTFAHEWPQTRIDLLESVLGGTDEALLEGQVDLAVGTHVPAGFLGDPVMQVRFVCSAHPDHALHHLGRPVTLADLRRHRHLVVRDSGTQRTREGGWLNEYRWTVSHKATSIRAACMGLGFAWYPEEAIREELEQGRLRPLPLEQGLEQYATLYLVFADRDAAGPGTRRLAEIIRVAAGALPAAPALSGDNGPVPKAERS